jgi:hypothetical protein
MIDGVAVIDYNLIVVTMRDGTEFTLTDSSEIEEFLNWYNEEYRKWKRCG